GGGWRSKATDKFNYVIAVFDSANLKDMLGQIDTGAYPEDVAFHPKLNMGVAYHGGKELILFNAKSFVKKGTLNTELLGSPPKLLFGGQGKKVIFVSRPQGPPAEGMKPGGGVQILALTLNDDEKATLEKAYKP